MAHDSIPPADPEFHNWVVPFSAYVTANAAAMGVDPADATTLTAAVGVWTTAYPAHKTATGSAVAARTVKDQSRSNLEDIARPRTSSCRPAPR